MSFDVIIIARDRRFGFEFGSCIPRRACVSLYELFFYGFINLSKLNYIEIEKEHDAVIC